jgi:hypothetical protein
MLKKIISMTIIAMVVVIISCQTEDDNLKSRKEIPQDVLVKIKALGFSTLNVQRLDDGYLVEGDIVLLDKDFGRGKNTKVLRIADSEQYHTTNLVSTPRVITVSVASNLGATYVEATDSALARYNAETLDITFQRVSQGADIQIVRANFFEQMQFLASAGFPTAAGEPHDRIKVSNNQLAGQPMHTIVSVLAHEIGHCVGFRHTDFMNRSFSCGGAPVNEGASTVGAIHIPGTPTGPDAGSFMLSCIGSGQNRPFNPNDKIALDYLY